MTQSPERRWNNPASVCVFNIITFDNGCKFSEQLAYQKRGAKPSPRESGRNVSGNGVVHESASDCLLNR